jgi:hypothetical protein
VLSAETADMFVNYQGVMLGNKGEVWIAQIVGTTTPLVIALNNKL